MEKTYFVVRNVSSVKDGVLVAAGTIAGSPNLETSDAVTNGDWGLYKVPAEGEAPTGAAVVELSREEAQLSAQSELFNGEPTVPFIQHEQECAQYIRAQFMAAQASLSIAEAESLFTLLEPTSHALSSGSLNIAYTRFNASAVDVFTKDLFNPLFEDFFQKFPRSLA
jgi:hypothetical protein